MAVKTKVAIPTYHVEDVLNPKNKPYTYENEKLLANLMVGYNATFVSLEDIYAEAEDKYKHMLDVIFTYLEAENIELIHSHWASHACISFNKEHNKAVIMFGTGYLKELTTAEFLAVLMHEVGHYLDFKYYDEPNKEEIMELEMIAWKLGGDVLNALGYDDWHEFNDIKKFGLMSYVYDDEYTYNLYMKRYGAVVKKHLIS